MKNNEPTIKTQTVVVYAQTSAEAIAKASDQVDHFFDTTSVRRVRGDGDKYIARYNVRVRTFSYD